jgi:predicted ATPase
MFLKSIEIKPSEFPTHQQFPFNVRAFQETSRIDLVSPITFFVGDNGTGKSALLDAIARKSGFLPWGGSKIHRAHHNPFETQLANYLQLTFDPRHRYGFHFRAETFFNFASSLDDILLDDPARDKYFGGGSLNVLSHGESFLAFFKGYSFQLDGLYLLDEPESALSPRNQVDFVRLILDSVQIGNKQYIMASHSPIILSCPGAQILGFDSPPIATVPYTDSSPYHFYKEFLRHPEKFFEGNGKKHPDRD